MTALTQRALTAVGLSLALGIAQAEQACRDDIPATAPAGRFQANGDGTLTDTSTGLIWKQCAEGLSGAGCARGAAETFTWQQALQRAEEAYFAASNQWRLPNIKELASLVEYRCHTPAINLNVFPNTPPDAFWTSSPRAGESNNAWLVDFKKGRDSGDIKIYTKHARLVRAGR